MTSFRKQLAICVVLLTGAAVTWEYRADLLQLWRTAPPQTASGQSGPERSGGTPVIVEQTVMMQDDRTLSAIGTGFATRAITLRAPSSGEIVEFSIAPGRRFAEGDTLMRLEDADQRFAVSLAQTRFDQASDERARYLRLQDSGVAAVARLEEIETNFQVTQIELERAKEDLDNRVLRAPFDGITGLASVEVGDRIATDDTIVSFDDRTDILVEFDLPEALSGRVSIGLGVTATTPSVEGRNFDGMISAIDSRVNAATRTKRVRATLENSDDLLRPGASFAVNLALPGNAYPAIPELALQFSQGSLHVWRVSNGTAEQVEVRLVRRSAGQVIVDGALSAGDLVVVEGTQRLRSGGAVRVLNTPTGPST